MSKPSEFYVGVLDFFAILLPGAIATAILAPRLGTLVIGPLVAVPTTEAAGWAAFLACAYVLGHLLFLVGSFIDPFYNVVRERLQPYGHQSAYACARRVRDALVDDDECQALNVYQWSRAVLIAKSPLAAEDIHRLEADSKFFRSLIVICVLAATVLFLDAHALQGAIALALIAPFFARYYERRLKSTTQAYLHVITMHRLGQLVPEGGLATGEPA